MFVNILANARDASKTLDTITIDTFTDHAMTDQPMLELCFGDEGHGMSAATMNQMFEPFFTTRNPGQGTGLGLAIVTTIVEEHGGKIRAESISPCGTNVFVSLPLYSTSGIELASGHVHY